MGRVVKQTGPASRFHGTCPRSNLGHCSLNEVAFSMGEHKNFEQYIML